jgi:hypothetical protein
MRLKFVLSLAQSLLVLILLAGCATQAKYQKSVESWVGRSSRELVHALGTPEKVEALKSGGHLISYTRSKASSAELGGIPSVFGEEYEFVQVHNDTGAVPRSYDEIVAAPGATTYNKSCLTYFEVNPGGKITRAGFSGSDCKSR